LLLPPTPKTSPFPYTTLFRSMYGIDAFTAIVNAPQAAILAVSRMADRVVAVGGQAVIQPMIVFSLSCDHRVIDGARGAQFLATLDRKSTRLNSSHQIISYAVF